MFNVEVISDDARFAQIRSEWNELLASSGAQSVFLTWEWLHTWWKHLGGGRRLSIVTLRCGMKLIAVAPLTLRRAPFAMLEFLGVGSVGSDYLDFIVRRPYERAAADTFIDYFATAGLTLRLPGVREDSFVAAEIAPALSRSGWRVRSVPMQVSPRIDLASHTWDSYLQSCGASHRYNFRRRLRRLERSYAMRFENAALQEVIDLHLQRWTPRGGSDGLHEPRLLVFHEEFTRLAHDNGWLRLRRLTLDGHVAAALYGLLYGSTYSFYQSGFDAAYANDSVGLVLLGLTIKEAIEEGAAEYDFLHGDESYKFLWTSDVRPLNRIELYPPGVAGRVHRNSVLALTATKKIVKRALYAPLSR